MSTARVVYVSHFVPSVIGNGGAHRALQVLHDARRAVDNGVVAQINLELWRRGRVVARQPRGNQLNWDILGRKWARLVENPFKVFRSSAYATAVPFSIAASVEPAFIKHYVNMVRKDPGPTVCIIEHAMFGELVDINQRLGIPTVTAFQNLEALDCRPFDWRTRRVVYRVMTDLGNELRLMGRCARRLAISKVEAGFISGLGITCDFYPYVPVDALRERLFATRRRREITAIEPGLFVLLGSAQHGVTWESMTWFVDMIRQRGLPRGVRVVAAGGATDSLLPPGETLPGLELRGWVEQSELEALLARALAAVIPHRLGFGALTRLPELACAGVPVITFDHAAAALEPPPGLRSVAPDWDEVCAAMREQLQHREVVDQQAYERWEANQPRPLERVIHQLAA